jgi:hypothetical protein
MMLGKSGIQRNACMGGDVVPANIQNSATNLSGKFKGVPDS